MVVWKDQGKSVLLSIRDTLNENTGTGKKFLGVLSDATPPRVSHRTGAFLRGYPG
jgi:hypothetical protein